MTNAKLISNATVTAVSTADKRHLALDMSGVGLERIRVLLSLSQAKDLFCRVDLAVADMETKQPGS